MITAEPMPMLAGLTTPGDDWATSSLEALPALRLAQLQAIYDGAPVGLCFLDRQFRYISLNQRLAEMTGFSVKSHIGRSVKDMYPDWFPTLEQYLLRSRAGEAISGVTLHRPGVAPGDRGMELLSSYQPAWDEADEVVGISISLLDITQHRPSGEAPLRLGDPQPHGTKVNPEVPWVMDAEGNNLQVSSRWVQTIPLGKDRTRNLHWLEALHVEDLEKTIRTMKHALRTGEAIDIEYRVMSVQGEWRWMRSRGYPRFAPSGEITRWYGSVEDIHAQKLQEQTSSHESQPEDRADHETLAKGIILSAALQSSIAEAGGAEAAS
jgi:PAS domain S-box-containing protein